MKLSVSVPDELWTRVAGQGSSPSEVVQTALATLASRRSNRLRFGGDPEVIKANQELLDQAVERLRIERKSLEEKGYRAGARLAAESDMLTLDWFREFVGDIDPEQFWYQFVEQAS